MSSTRPSALLSAALGRHRDRYRPRPSVAPCVVGPRAQLLQRDPEPRHQRARRDAERRHARRSSPDVALDEPYASRAGGCRTGHLRNAAIHGLRHGDGRGDTQRAFDRSSRRRRSGTGSALAAVYGIVQQSGGHIWLYSEPGLGTTFKLYFPVAAESPSPPCPRPRPGHTSKGTRSILLVEDTEMVRRARHVGSPARTATTCSRRRRRGGARARRRRTRSTCCSPTSSCPA